MIIPSDDGKELLISKLNQLLYKSDNLNESNVKIFGNKEYGVIFSYTTFESNQDIICIIGYENGIAMFLNLSKNIKFLQNEEIFKDISIKSFSLVIYISYINSSW